MAYNRLADWPDAPQKAVLRNDRALGPDAELLIFLIFFVMLTNCIEPK
jgi:hypothetical protein